MLDGLLEERGCWTCGSEQWFEVPDCRDGHGDDCPERACTACGGALVVGLPGVPREARRGSHLAVVA